MTPAWAPAPLAVLAAKPSHPAFPARLPAAHWTLMWVSLGVAAAARLAADFSWQVTFTALFFLLSTAAMIRTLRLTLATRALGPGMLAAGCWLFFALEAMAGALESPPFLVPSDLRIGESQFSTRVVGDALICVAIYQLALAGGYSLRLAPSLPIRALLFRLDTLRSRWAITQVLIALLVLVPLYVAFGTDYDRAMRVIQQARAGSLDDMFPGLEMNLYWVSLFSCTVLLVEGVVYERRWGRWRAAVGLLLSSPLWLTGTRHLAVYLIMPVILAWLLTQPGRGLGRKVIRMILILLVVVVVLQAILLVRSYGWDHLAEVDLGQILTSKPTYQFESLLVAVYLVPQRHDYFYEPMTPFFVIHWIPRRLWPAKPIPAAWTYYNSTWVENRKTNVTPSIIGQFYINWGTPGVVLIGFWLGWLTAMCDRVAARIDPARQRLALVTLGMFYAFVFCSFRYYSPFYLQYWLFGALVMLALTRQRLRLPREAG